MQLGIKLQMRTALVLCLAVILLASSHPASAADGTFSGKVIDPPNTQPLARGWIFVQGRNRMLRRVEVAHAVVVFGEQVPLAQRHKCNFDCISAGQEVSVTARQDSAGEWRAKRVEILHLATQVAHSPRKSLPLPNFTPKAALRRITNMGYFASHRTRVQSI